MGVPEERWPPYGIYGGKCCTCDERCPPDCKGVECGCEACRRAYLDFLAAE